MNFLVVGPGAMGCLFASRLKGAGHDVVMADYRPERAELINRDGILLEQVDGRQRVRVPVVTDRPGRKIDAALIFVKANRTEAAARMISAWLESRTSILTLQNGLGNVELLRELFGEERVLGGVTSEGATLLGTGHARHAGSGQTVIGPRGKEDGPAAKIVSAFRDAGFDTRSSDQVENLIWGKLIVNVGINALTAIVRLKNGLLPRVEGAREVMRMAVMEAEQVARARGITLPYPHPFERVLEVCHATAENRASMLQDVLGMRITEISFINGAVVREGTRLGIPTPVNLTLSSLVSAIQETYRDRVTD